MLKKIIKLPPEVLEKIGYYVYLYIDPFTDKIFYVGKGIGNRVFSHLFEESETEKTKKIAEIQSRGKEPKIEFLRYGLTEKEATLIEASVIDLIGFGNLTNKIRGFHSRSYGRFSTEEVLLLYKSEPVRITHKVLIIIINKRYERDMSPEELYEITRGIWRVGKRRENVEFAFAVFLGVVREVYKIIRWHPAGTLHYSFRDSSYFKNTKRWEFEGVVAEEIRNMYVNKSIKQYFTKGSQNPVKYINV